NTAARLAPVARKFLWGSLALTPAVFLAHYVLGASGTVVFALSALALVPLAWLIGEATEHVAEHTGPGIGGFVNASFGNAPELLVHTLGDFGRALGLSQFFVAVVIVAIVGNAAEHGGAIVVARRGNMELAAEIAISSSAQVAVFVAPAIALISWLVGRGLPFT